MASRRLHYGHSLLGYVVAQVCGGGYAVFEIILMERFLQSYGYGFQIASGQASVGGIALGQDEQVLFLLG